MSTPNETATIPSRADRLKAYNEGREAALRREHVNDRCPYAFNVSGMTPSRFDVEMRPLFNAWFNGWHSELDKAGLGFNFEPIRKRK